MKLTKIAAACAVLCSGHAFAVVTTPSDAAGATTIRISGSSALQKTLGVVAEGMMTDISEYWSDAKGSSHRAYLGRAKAGIPGVPQNTVLLIKDRAKGGSTFGVKPVQSNTGTVQHMVINTGCTPVAATTPPRYTCATTTAEKSNVGVTDVESKLLSLSLNSGSADPELALIPAPTPTEISNYNANGGSQLAVIFGVPMTNDMRPYFPKGLTRAQVTSILVGAVADWSALVPAPATTLAPSTVPAGPITICRRTNGSGTQAAFNAYFGGYGCTASAVTPLNAAASTSVIESTSSGGVIDCLNTHTGAIGLLSTETVASATDNWDFVALDLTTPVPKENATAGIYDFFVEQQMHWNNTGLNTVQKAVVAEFFKRSGDPAILTPLAGVAALPNNYAPASPGDVMKGTRQGDSCAATQLWY